MKTTRTLGVFFIVFILGGIFLYVLLASDELNVFTNKNNSPNNHMNGNTDVLVESNDIVKKAELKNIQIALEQYYSEHGNYPESLSILTQEGYLSSMPIDLGTLSYDRPDPIDYKLTIMLSNGEEYSLRSE